LAQKHPLAVSSSKVIQGYYLTALWQVRLAIKQPAQHAKKGIGEIVAVGPRAYICPQGLLHELAIT